MDTRIFLLSEMANAQNLPDFFMAYRALENYNRLLVAEQTRKQPSLGTLSGQSMHAPQQPQPPEPAWAKPISGTDRVGPPERSVPHATLPSLPSTRRARARSSRRRRYARQQR